MFGKESLWENWAGESGSVVERLLAKEKVAGSIPVSRSKKAILRVAFYFLTEVVKGL